MGICNYKNDSYHADGITTGYKILELCVHMCDSVLHCWHCRKVEPYLEKQLILVDRTKNLTLNSMRLRKFVPRREGVWVRVEV